MLAVIINTNDIGLIGVFQGQTKDEALELAKNSIDLSYLKLGRPSYDHYDGINMVIVRCPEDEQLVIYLTEPLTQVDHL